MNWLSEALKSSLGEKLIMSLTGSFLILFLVGHMLGNLLLFKDDGGQSFNEYAKFMSTTPFILVLSLVTYVSIIVHIIYSIVVSRKNRAARPIDYAVTNPNANSLWTSRNMGILGTLILIFIVIHLRSFWYEMKFGSLPIIDYGGSGKIKNLYLIVAEAFSQLWYVALYVVAMAALALHLSHGFTSAFQTLGLTHVKYTPFIKRVGMAFAIIVPIVFASMPVYMYLKSMGIL